VTFCNGVIANDSAFQLGRQKGAAHDYNGPLMRLRMTFRNDFPPFIAETTPRARAKGTAERLLFAPVTNYFRSVIA